MSQRLGSSLRRKVSETETQLLALHEAKLAAISGNIITTTVVNMLLKIELVTRHPFENGIVLEQC